MTETINIFIGIVVLLGSLLSLVTTIGLIRLPDVYTRSHAASKSATLGVLLILVGALLYFWFADNYFSARLVLGIVFVFITAPVAGHLISRAAYYTNVPLWGETVQDDLKTKERPKTKKEVEKRQKVHTEA
ncbi:monovalent cation/H(+) antiporter subunit G [Sutcliffiella horikoshii]|uniref:Na+/H+ antiporter subunit G n=1 Tax=Sutcliffiella horikoshii TaxID=79883 RepID=A0A1Y0CR87_9BACI|nr:monovalent cation/H(+) antiporter subunit G [Sutcliffiella horikoshii]ART77809.1 Na+/H+ antiporter subunit G [Sutcliffiella horikoshii]TYS60242.1 Na+/H+ antiporter subunit G [Sutcliffiella horikoshii]